MDVKAEFDSISEAEAYADQCNDERPPDEVGQVVYLAGYWDKVKHRDYIKGTGREYEVGDAAQAADDTDD